MEENNLRLNALTIGKYVFAGPTLNVPVAQVARPTNVQVAKMRQTLCILGELGWAAHILYANEWLQGEKMSPEETKACSRDLAKNFRHYCPNIKKDVTNMEIHATVKRALDAYDPVFTKRDLQSIFMVYQNWQKLSGDSLKTRREKVWIGRGLSMVMNSRYYKSALSKDENWPIRNGGRDG